MAYQNPLNWAERALAADDPEHAWKEILAQLSRFDLGDATFVFGQPTDTKGVSLPGMKFGTFLDQEWDRRVHEDLDLAMSDPIARRFLVSESVLQVERGNELFLSMSEEEQAFFDNYDEYGIQAGTVWPVHDRKAGLVHLLVTWTKGDRLGYFAAANRFSTDIHVAVTYFSEALRVRQLAKERFPPTLSPRERECLLWVQAGQSTKQIGDRLNIGDNTVNEYIASAMRKLNASNRTQAAARAALLNLIHP